MSIRVLICIISLALAGCGSTIFESLPLGATTDCDPRLVGTWRTGEWVRDGAAGKVSEEDAEYALITRQCRLLDWYTRRPPSELRDQTSLEAKLRFIAGKNGGFAYSRTDLADPDGSAKPWATGYLLFRYVVSQDRIAVYQVDNARVARLIKARRIASGRSIVINNDEHEDEDFEPEYINFVPGTQEQIAALLKSNPDIFHARPMGILHRYKGVPPPEPGEENEPVDVDDEDRKQ